jgi:hypothetical protein
METVPEQRLAALEQEVARLKQRLDQVLSQASWLERVAGSMKDEPEFEEVVKLGAAIRQSIEVPTADNPWVRLEGVYKDDPLFDEWQAAIAEYRRQVDLDRDAR